jgi:hypothetical protein
MLHPFPRLLLKFSRNIIKNDGINSHQMAYYYCSSNHKGCISITVVHCWMLWFLQNYEEKRAARSPLGRYSDVARLVLAIKGEHIRTGHPPTLKT